MAFSEKIKNEVKKKAAFRCCRCQAIGIDVHHIIPVSKGGSDEIENAAPLCQNCHDQFGDNPKKRKEIREMRDWWSDVCGKKYVTYDSSLDGKVDELNTTVKLLQQGQQNLLPQFKESVKAIFLESLEYVTPSSSADFATGIVQSSTGISSQFPACRKCGKTTTVLIEGLCGDCYSQ